MLNVKKNLKLYLRYSIGNLEYLTLKIPILFPWLNVKKNKKLYLRYSIGNFEHLTLKITILLPLLNVFSSALGWDEGGDLHVSLCEPKPVLDPAEEV